jgi:uncharacterized repeat protein (TIGR03803 family)
MIMNMFDNARRFFGLALGASLLVAAAASHGQVLAVLHEFDALVSYTNNDGAEPFSGVTQGQDGSFYGVTEDGGTNGTGTIFKITPQGAFVLVHTFSKMAGYTNADGSYPQAKLTLGHDGALYGTTVAGGTNGNYGTVFKITTNDTLITLHAFNFNDGENSAAPLVLGRDGNFYGATALGGTTDNGTLFEISSEGSFQTLYNFSFGSNTISDIYTNNDGSRPYGLTQGTDGNFYGTADFGGTNGNGTVFEFTTNGVFKVLHTFSPQGVHGENADGAAPQSPLTQGPDGAFYGTTPNGGAYAGGTIFRVTPGGDFSTVLSFEYFTNGVSPYDPLLLENGVFFGTAGDFANGGGTIFQVTTNGAVTLLYEFSEPGTNSENLDGAYPDAGLTLGHDGNLYGTTSAGGTNGTGVVFRLSFPTLSISIAGELEILSWPTNQTGFVLQSTTDLNHPSWDAALPAPTIVGDQFVVSNAPAASTTFYRLIK